MTTTHPAHNDSRTERTTSAGTTLDWPTFGHVTTADIRRFLPGLEGVTVDELTPAHPTCRRRRAQSRTRDRRGCSEHGGVVDMADLRRFAAVGLLHYDPDGGVYRSTVDVADRAYARAAEDFLAATGGTFGTLRDLPDRGACRVVLTGGGLIGVGRDGGQVWERAGVSSPEFCRGSFVC
jgi:hypothetical protein